MTERRGYGVLYGLVCRRACLTHSEESYKEREREREMLNVATARLAMI